MFYMHCIHATVSATASNNAKGSHTHHLRATVFNWRSAASARCTVLAKMYPAAAATFPRTLQAHMRYVYPHRQHRPRSGGTSRNTLSVGNLPLNTKYIVNLLSQCRVLLHPHYFITFCSNHASSPTDKGVFDEFPLDPWPRHLLALTLYYPGLRPIPSLRHPLPQFPKRFAAAVGHHHLGTWL